ncbi:MAG: cytochrome c peroxidase [Verrucomicrobiota bacterium]
MKRPQARVATKFPWGCPAAAVVSAVLAPFLGMIGFPTALAEPSQPLLEIPPELQLSPLPARAPENPGNPANADKIELGRLLFFDPILSADGNVACATCHHPGLGWSDGRPTPIGVDGVGLGPLRLPRGTSGTPLPERNTPGLVNVVFNGVLTGRIASPERAPMFWDSRVQSLEVQALIPIENRGEMRGESCPESEGVPRAVDRIRKIAEYRERFTRIFGGPPDTSVHATNLARALAVFERSLVAPNTPLDRFLAGDAEALSPQQRAGLREFQDSGCILCHGGPMLSDFKLHVLGVPDSSAGGRRSFRTPTLRQLQETAPYMHNGRYRTLDAVLQFYEETADAAGEARDGGDTSLQPPLDPLLAQLRMNPARIGDLKVFLESIQDDHYDRTIPLRVPSGLPVAGR